VVVDDGSRRKEFDAVCLTPLLPVVVADTIYSSFALPWVETKDAGMVMAGI
jgi:hypothetical protein